MYLFAADTAITYHNKLSSILLRAFAVDNGTIECDMASVLACHGEPSCHHALSCQGRPNECPR